MMAETGYMETNPDTRGTQSETEVNEFGEFWISFLDQGIVADESFSIP